MAAVSDDLDKARQRRQRHRSARPVGAFGPSQRKQQVINRVLDKVDAAAERADPAAFYAGKAPTPQRITTALDLCELYGPEVDRALGGEEPMVDEWESGARVPGVAQMQALSALTGFPLAFFYKPPSPPITNGWMCSPGGCRPLGDDRECTCGGCPLHG